MPTARNYDPAVTGKTQKPSMWDYVEVLRDVRVVVMIFQYSACFGTDPRLLSLCFPSTFSAILAAIGAHPCNLAFKSVYLSLFVCVCVYVLQTRKKCLSLGPILYLA